MTPETPPLSGEITSATNTTRNMLALISFFASLYALVAYLVTLGTAFLPSLRPLELLGLPTPILAIVFGHLALMQSKPYPANKRIRCLAATGLVIGYVELATLVFYGAVIWYALTHFK